MKLEVSIRNIDPKLLSGRATKTERAMAFQVMKDTRRYVPADTMSLNNRTYVRGNAVVYPGPYARYLYYGKRMVNAKTGKGPMYIPEVGWRWPHRATLRPTDQELHISTAVHKDATHHWLDAAKRRYMAAWKKIAAKVYANGR